MLNFIFKYTVWKKGGLFMEKLVSKIQNAHLFFMIILYISFVFLIFIQVIFRYVFHTSILWAQEFSTVLFVWVVFLSAAYSLKIGNHFILNIINYKKISKRVDKIVNIIVSIVLLFCILVLIYYGYNYTLMGFRGVSPSIGIKMSWSYSAIPVSGLLMLLYWLNGIFAGGLSFNSGIDSE